MKKYLAILPLYLVGAHAWSADSLLGVGKAPCSEVLKINANNPDVAQLTFMNWVVGYVAGKNSALKENRGALGSSDAVWNGIISACTLSSDQESYTLHDASEDLYAAMKAQEDYIRKKLSH